MKYRPNAIVLGGTLPHISLIQNLKGRGYHTTLLDYLENPPAKGFADQHLVVSTLDQEKVLQIAGKLKAKLVISTCIDQANVTACYVAEKLGLPRPYSYDESLNVTNKGLMKKIMIENDIPTSDYIVIQNPNGLSGFILEFPVVVKPIDSNSSKGVKRAENLVQLNKYLVDALALSRTNNAIIEKFIEGKEIQIDCFSQNDKVHIVLIRQKQKLINTPGTVMQSYGSILPVDIPKNTLKELINIAQKIANAFHLKNTPFFIQAIIHNDKINVIEFAPRIGGGLSYSMIKRITGFDIVDAAINSYLGVPTNISIKPSQYVYGTYIIYMNPGIYDRIEGCQNLLDENIIEEFYNIKTAGTRIDNDMASSNRVGAFLIKAESKKELVQKSKKAIQTLEVYDIYNQPLMKKDIYFKGNAEDY